jgi:ABC-2 type transport system permease protein
MAVYKRTYKAYQGAMTPGWSRFTVLSRYGFATLFSSRMFTAFTVLCFVPFLLGLVFVYVLHSATAQQVLHSQMGRNTDQIMTNYWFLWFLWVHCWMSFLLTAWAAPGMISKDFANHSVQLYLSRPLSRAEYLLGKVSVLGVLLSFTTWVPTLLVFLLHATLEGHGWGWDHLWLAFAIIAAGLIWIALIALLAMSMSVLVKWRIASTALLLAIFFLLPGFGLVVSLILRTRWGLLLNLFYVIGRIWAQLFRVPVREHFDGPFGLVPTWSAWATVLTVCMLCLWLLHSKLKAREVERG